MKKLVILLFLVIISSSSFVLAGEEITPNETIKDSYSEAIIEGDVIEAGEVYGDETQEDILRWQNVKVKITSGDYQGIILSIRSVFYQDDAAEYQLETGEKVKVNITLKNNEIETANIYEVLGRDIEETSRILKAKVLEAHDVREEYDDMAGANLKYQDLKVEIIDKEFKGQIFDVEYALSLYLDKDLNADTLVKGDKVLIYADIQDGVIVQANMYDVIRHDYIILMIILFFAGIIAIGGKQGLKAIISLVITILAIAFITIPGILNGINPLLITIITSILVTVITYLLISGFSQKTICAILGTTAGIVAAGLLAMIFGGLMKLTGVCEEEVMLNTLSEQFRFDYRGLMFSGIVIGALGACMDVGMSIASAIYELKKENPDMPAGRLFKAGMNIGRDVMGTMTNTLILAYVGSSLTMILIFVAFQYEFIDVINRETICTEILRSLAGSTGLVCTIPLTAFVSSILMGKKDKKNK